mmetsp:Transcript_32126/g.85706  ORF Transcript_32126/g.85706 Transcript_32126/m.85706 type:complete len:101 (-) Transcript_32126:451-753(-)
MKIFIIFATSVLLCPIVGLCIWLPEGKQTRPESIPPPSIIPFKVSRCTNNTPMYTSTRWWCCNRCGIQAASEDEIDRHISLCECEEVNVTTNCYFLDDEV